MHMSVCVWVKAFSVTIIVMEKRNWRPVFKSSMNLFSIISICSLQIRQLNAKSESRYAI